MNFVMTISPDCEGFAESYSDSVAAQGAGAVKERGVAPEHQLWVLQKLLCLFTRLHPQQRGTAGGQRTGEDKRGTKVGRSVTVATQNVTPPVFLSFISIPALFLLGVVVLGGITGMLLGFSQVLLRSDAGIHTAGAAAMPGGPSHTGQHLASFL